MGAFQWAGHWGDWVIRGSQCKADYPACEWPLQNINTSFEGGEVTTKSVAAKRDRTTKDTKELTIGNVSYTPGLAKATGLSRMTISRIWQAFGLQPHRSETFKLSPDPQLIDKARDIVGLYMNLLDHARSSVWMRRLYSGTGPHATAAPVTARRVGARHA